MKLEEMGLDPARIERLVVEEITKSMLCDEEGISTEFEDKLIKATREKIGEAVDKVVAKTVGPKVDEMVEDACLQQTNRWGEATGTKQTFTEFIVARAEGYLTEKVDLDGNTKAESRRSSFNWNASTTRVSHMIDTHLKYTISNAMEKALMSANSQIASGLAEAVKIELEKITNKLKVEVRT